jgi:choline dehydrogenase-like flavoprotein
MSMITASKTQPSYDVIVVGSGAGGGQTAYTCAMAGAKVLMLEAGRNYDPVAETPMFQLESQAPLRGASTPDKERGFYDATVDAGNEIPGEPYTNASDRGEEKFQWWRARMLGGRTNHWGRVSLRNGPYDFKPRSRDGLGFDWPISYEDVAPYDDRVEMLIGVFGTNEGLENTPNSSSGVLLPPPKPRAAEMLVRERAKAFGIPVVPAHRAILSVRQDADTLPARLHPNNPKNQRILAEAMRSRAACFWATHCRRGCSIRANYQSTTVHLPPALATGNLDILPDAMVHRVNVDDRGRATGVSYIDKTTGRETEARGRVVVLAASSASSVRILLNSRSPRFPNGLANGSGLVGKCIMDTTAANVGGQIPALENMPLANEDGAGGAHMYIPWWLYREQHAGKLGFPRGYHVEGFGGHRQMPDVRIGAGLDNLIGGGYGRKYKEEARRYYGSTVGFSGRGEMVPNENSYCELDPAVRDKWGIPVLRFHWKWSDYELKQVEHMQETFTALVEALGGKVRERSNPKGGGGINPPGSTIHEVGGAIMGDSPKTSVANRWNQTWEIKNLFINDGAPFASNADKNPTLTIMALAWRASDYLLEELAISHPDGGRLLYDSGRDEGANCDYFLLDCKSHREMHDPANPARKGLTMLGAEQKAWLLEEMRRSTSDFFFLVSSVNFMIPHIGGGGHEITEGKDEAWTALLNEREELIDAFDALEKPVFILTADLYNSFAVKITDRVWEFASAPLNSVNHVPRDDEGNRPATGLSGQGRAPVIFVGPATFCRIWSVRSGCIRTTVSCR